MKMIFVVPVLLTGILLVFSCKKDESTGTTEKYFPKVKAIIQANCLSCHGSSGTWEGRPTKFDTDDDIVAAYTSIKASVADPVTPGPLGNKRMPQGGMLSANDVDIIVKWYDKGGKATD